MQIRFKIVRQPCWSARKGDKNNLVDSEKTPQSCVDVVFELLASTASTSSSNSLPESLQLLQYQLQAEHVMCLLVSLVVCKQNIEEEHPTMQW